MLLRLNRVLLAYCLSLGMLASVVQGNVAFAAESSESKEISQIVSEVTKSVVAIIGKTGDSEWDNDRFNLQHGTGVIVREDGYIITNAHVVKDMSNIVVVTSEGVSYNGKTTHFDEESDLALVKVDASRLPVATFADQSDIKVGEPVMAIGTPLSFALRNSVTAGIVSGIERSVNSEYQLIQTDAAINPGNSGGALVNANGHVIGINTMKFVDYGVDNLGFAIPVDTVQYVLKHFYEYGKVKRPYLGLVLEESWAAVVGLPSKAGLRVSYVDPDSPAAEADIQQGDVLVSINEDDILSLVHYNEVLKNYLPDETVMLTVRRNSGDTVKREIVLDEDTSSGADWTPNEDGDGIDSDIGKTKIGDSHHGWSMNYPAGLIQSSQTDDGDSVMFASSTGEYGISIRVEEQKSENLSVAGLMQKVFYGYGVVLEKQYVEDADQPYVKITGKSDDGSYYLMRAYYADNKIYYVDVYIDNEDYFNNKSKLNSLIDLVDSFKLSFDKSDSSLKDISNHDSRKQIANEYGLSFELPSGWTDDEWGDSSFFYNYETEQSISIDVTSASSGDTLKDWASRDEAKFKSQYVEQYRTVKGMTETEVDGVPAIENVFSSAMGDQWTSNYTLYLIKDRYKYQLDIGYPQDADAEEIDNLIDEVVESITFDKERMNPSLGFIQDVNDLLDPNRTFTYKNTTYQYSLQVPETWYFYDYDSYMDSGSELFGFLGGSLIVDVEERSTLEDVAKDMEQAHKDSADKDTEYQYTVEDVTVFGVPGKKFEHSYESENVPYTRTEYVFQRDKYTYTVTLEINDAVKTEENLKRLESAFQSFAFIDEK